LSDPEQPSLLSRARSGPIAPWHGLCWNAGKSVVRSANRAVSRRSENRAARLVEDVFTVLAGSRLWKSAALLLVLVLSVLRSSDALAQTQTITLGRIGRYRPPDTDPNDFTYRSTRPWWISYEDCIANDVLVFPITVSSTSHRLEVWAGTDNCADKRGNTTDHGQCWLVGSQEQLTRTFDVRVPVRNVVAQRFNSTTVPSNLTEDVCEGSTDTDGTQVTFYFLIEDGGKSVSSVTWTGSTQGTGFDLVGPDPPTGISIGMGERQLSISIGDITANDELQRLGLYCAKQGDGVESDTGDFISADAGTATTTPAPQECFTPLLVGGKRPLFGLAQELGIDLSCGQASKTSGTIRTKTLDNDTTYAVGVAGEDLLGNPGVLSEIQCGTPRELKDFFELYKENGGRGGGGFCSFSPGVSRSAPGAGLLFGILFAALRVRRWKSRA